MKPSGLNVSVDEAEYVLRRLFQELYEDADGNLDLNKELDSDSLGELYNILPETFGVVRWNAFIKAHKAHDETK